MKVLLDENMPHGLRSKLRGHDVFTTAHQGWDGVRNGLLLENAEKAGFEVLLTADQSIAYQQNLHGRLLGLVVINTNSWLRIKKNITVIAEGLGRSKPGLIVYVEL